MKKFIAMNRFKILSGKEEIFEDIWRNRDSHLKDVSGFINFNLIKSSKSENYTLYASHSIWRSENDFINWTKSESFRLAHKDAGKHKDLYIGHPEFEGFDIVI
tara:strand:- start:47 stop:355 length:309 start_codon:yes stop_codon:yes gene_type:complete